jgi:uncharacterized protein
MATARVLDPELVRFVRERLPALRARFAPEHLVLFGSRARNEAGPDSDIDLLVVSSAFREVKRPLRASEVLLALRYPGAVDALCFTPEEFAHLRQQPGLVATACEEGIWL